MKTNFTPLILTRTKRMLFGLLFFVLMSHTVSAQLGVYSFTGVGACPNQNPAVTTQPANAVFSNFTTVGTTCVATSNVFQTNGWNITNTINLAEYNEFTVTPNSGYNLTISNIIVNENTDVFQFGGAYWRLRSSIDNYASNLGGGLADLSSSSYTINLAAANFSFTGPVTFRLYVISINAATTSWLVNNVTVNGTVNIAPADPSNPTSNSPQCQIPGVTLTSSGSAPAGETWYWQTAANGTSTVNSGPTYIVTTSGTYHIRARDNTTMNWSTGSGSITVIVNSDVAIPVFTLGATSTHCQGAGTVTYTATATNNTGITYSLDAITDAFPGNSISTITGTVTYAAGWAGASTITATATGCNGPTTAIHSVTITPTVGTPVFTLGATSSR